MRAPATGYRVTHGASHKGDGLGKYPRVCAGCGRRVVITGPDSLQFHTWFDTNNNGQPQSWHIECRRNIRQAP